MTYYSAIIFLALMIMLIMDILVYGNDLIEKEQKLWIYTISLVLMACAFFEWFGLWMDGQDKGLRSLHILVKIMELSLAPSIAVLCSSLFSKLKYRKYFIGVLLAHGLLEVLSGFYGFIFYVDDTNHYRHGPYYWIYILTYLSGMILFICVLLRESHRYYSTNRLIMAVIPAFLLLGIVMQYMNSSIRVTWLCTAVDVFIIYNLYSELTQKLDGLTHLLNRRSYENRLSQMKENTMIFFFDVDKFKKMNDTYGHAMGDKVLIEIGSAIYTVFGKKGRCYRIGGDEFCAMISTGDGQPDKYIYDFYEELDNRRRHERNLPDVSVGYAWYTPEKGSVAEAIGEADRVMYERKRQKGMDRYATKGNNR